jgi:hypothetical protein
MYVFVPVTTSRVGIQLEDCLGRFLAREVTWRTSACSSGAVVPNLSYLETDLGCSMCFGMRVNALSEPE